MLLEWFDIWLKDKPNTHYPKVRLFTLGSNSWSEAAAFPPAHSQEKILFLNSKGRANSLYGDGILNSTAPENSPIENSRDCVVCDPAVPVSSPGPGGAPGPYKQNRIEAGNNVLVYTSEALTSDLWVCGRPRAILHIQSSQANCDVVVKLVRVDLQGNAWNICIGAARAGKLFGPSFGLDNPDVPDVVRTWEIALDATSIRFSVGEKIRLEVAGNCFPLFDRSSGDHQISAWEAEPANWRRYTHQVLHDALAPSRLILPEVIA
jgi:putative CocE/NonD family hydrolase